MPLRTSGCYKCDDFTHSLFQLTVLNAGRKYLGLDSLAGKVFLTSGLGGMSGAQAKVKLSKEYSLNY